MSYFLVFAGIPGPGEKQKGKKPEESNKEFMNAMKQAGGASGQVPTFRFPIIRGSCTFFGNPLMNLLLNEELNYDRSGKIEIEATIQAAVEQTGDLRILYDIRSLQDTEGRPPISSLGIAEAA